MLYALAIITFVFCGVVPGVVAFLIARLTMPIWCFVLFIGLSYQLFAYVDQLLLLAAIRWETIAPWHGTWLAHGLIVVLSVLGGGLLTLLALLLAVVVALVCFGGGIYELCTAIYQGILEGSWNVICVSAQLGATRCAIAGALAGVSFAGADEST